MSACNVGRFDRPQCLHASIPLVHAYICCNELVFDFCLRTAALTHSAHQFTSCVSLLVCNCLCRNAATWCDSGRLHVRRCLRTVGHGVVHRQPTQGRCHSSHPEPQLSPGLGRVRRHPTTKVTYQPIVHYHRSHPHGHLRNPSSNALV